MDTETDKRVELFKTYIELAILDYPLVSGESLDSNIQFFKLQFAKFTKDITDAAEKIVRDFGAQNPHDEEILKSKLEIVINESRIRFSKRGN